ncbi:MAG: hypothetical protein Q9195_006306 [Heterodermia aff. obscurata]
MPVKSSRDPSPVDTWEEDGFEWVEADPYRKWDLDWQREWKPPTPTAAQTAVATAKNTWKNMTVASIKSGLYNAASVAASGAASQASSAAAKVAATGTAYVSQSIWGKPSAPQYDHGSAEEDAMTSLLPPRNAFNDQGKQNGDAKGAAAEGSFPRLGTRQRHSKPEERTGVKFDEAEVYYDPLGLSNEWHCPAAKREQETARRERLWAEWRAKPEREPRRIHQKPQLRVGGRLVETTSTATRTDHGLKETFHSDEERKSNREQARIPGLLFALESDSEEDEATGR